MTLEVTHPTYNNSNGKGKGTVHPITGHEGPEGEKMYSSILSLTSAIDVELKNGEI
jgi:hypothetical protein